MGQNGSRGRLKELAIEAKRLYGAVLLTVPIETPGLLVTVVPTSDNPPCIQPVYDKLQFVVNAQDESAFSAILVTAEKSRCGAVEHHIEHSTDASISTAIPLPHGVRAQLHASLGRHKLIHAAYDDVHIYQCSRALLSRALLSLSVVPKDGLLGAKKLFVVTAYLTCSSASIDLKDKKGAEAAIGAGITGTAVEGEAKVTAQKVNDTTIRVEALDGVEYAFAACYVVVELEDNPADSKTMLVIGVRPPDDKGALPKTDRGVVDLEKLDDAGWRELQLASIDELLPEFGARGPNTDEPITVRLNV